jgi:hypothetical protein
MPPTGDLDRVGHEANITGALQWPQSTLLAAIDSPSMVRLATGSCCVTTGLQPGLAADAAPATAWTKIRHDDVNKAAREGA